MLHTEEEVNAGVQAVTCRQVLSGKQVSGGPQPWPYSPIRILASLSCGLLVPFDALGFCFGV